MSSKYLFPALLLIIAGITALVFFFAHGSTIALLSPQGTIALQEHRLMFDALLLMLIVVVPVFVLTIGIAWRYRADNTKATYSPHFEENRLEEFIWWFVPCIIIVVLALVTWTTTHALDPFKPLESSAKPLTIEVVALNWKWLFIYPDEHIATVNYVAFPEQTPLNFHITADAPMNSFWIPQLGGQIYAMTGMSTELHLEADATGRYLGVSSNFSGKGFAGMQFTAESLSPSDFDAWVASAQHSSRSLNLASYATLAEPSENSPPAVYSLADLNLYNEIIMKFMPPGTTEGSMSGMSM